MKVASGLFKAYDIRGIVETALTPEAVKAIGQAIGSEARSRGLKSIAVGRDGRLSGPILLESLTAGLLEAGLDVIDVGLVATPMLYFTAVTLAEGSGVMVTGSHNPPEYNGLKMMLGGETLAGETIQRLHQRIEGGDFTSGSGRYCSHDIAPEYLSRITSDIRLSRPLKIAVDCGNGAPGAFAPALFRTLGCEVVELFCDVDGNFPNHHPDPSDPHNLQDLIRTLRETDVELGLAFDGDGDRLGVVTRSGSIIYPDRQLMLFAADVLGRNPGAPIIFDVKCTRNLAPWIREHGGAPIMWRTGHSLVKAKMRETHAPLAGEMSGHIFFKERWYGFDDGLYAGCRLLEILSRHTDPGAVLEALPDSISTPELHIKLNEGENHALMEALKQSARFKEAREIITIDGLRVEYPDGFGLMRPSNTTPVVVLRFEADDPASLSRIQDDFRRVILAEKPDAILPF